MMSQTNIKNKSTDIYHATEKDFQKAIHTIHRSKKYPSHLKLKVINSNN